MKAIIPVGGPGAHLHPLTPNRRGLKEGFVVLKYYLRRFLHVAKVKILTSRVYVSGVKYKFTTFTKNIINLNASHEIWLDDVYSSCLKNREGAFIDVGVNSGQTLMKILRIAPQREYIGFEPQASCVFFVDQFIRDNDLRNHQIIPVALSDKTEVCKIFLRQPGLDDTTASIASDFRPKDFYQHSSYIPTMRGDDIIDSIGIRKICVVKIDVEGAELEVLNGLENTIVKFRPYVMFEVLNNYLVVTRKELDEEIIKQRNERALLISEFFESAGYRVFNIRDGNLVETPVITPIVSGDLSITEYVGIPEELLDELPENFRIEPLAPRH